MREKLWAQTPWLLSLRISGPALEKEEKQMSGGQGVTSCFEVERGKKAASSRTGCLSPTTSRVRRDTGPCCCC